MPNPEYIKEEAPHKNLIFVMNKCDLVPTSAAVSSPLSLLLFFHLPYYTSPTIQVKALSSRDFLARDRPSWIGPVTMVGDQCRPPLFSRNVSCYTTRTAPVLGSCQPRGTAVVRIELGTTTAHPWVLLLLCGSS